MAKVNAPSLSARIDAVEIPSERRPHLGASQLGHSCKRYLWYSFHWAYKNSIPAKLNRIFRLGDAIEDLIVADLARVGKIVTHSQLRVMGYMGHGGGSIDGIIGDSLFEAKSMNVANFNKLKKSGVQIGFPVYYSQMQYYMGKLNLDEGLFVSMNKNTSDLYTETIKYDSSHFSQLVIKEASIITAVHNGFERVGYNSSWHECRFCNATDVCHNDAPMEVNCRTCHSVILKDEGKWECGKTGSTLDMKAQLEACKSYNG